MCSGFFGFLGSFAFKWPRRVGLRVGGWTGGFFEKGRKESGIEQDSLVLLPDSGA